METSDIPPEAFPFYRESPEKLGDLVKVFPDILDTLDKLVCAGSFNPAFVDWGVLFHAHFGGAGCFDEAYSMRYVPGLNKIPFYKKPFEKIKEVYERHSNLADGVETLLDLGTTPEDIDEEMIENIFNVNGIIYDGSDAMDYLRVRKHVREIRQNKIQTGGER